MEIQINGLKADFQEGSVNMGYSSPVFRDYGGEAALEITLPVTTNNKQILGYAHRLDCELAQGKTYSVLIKAGGYEKAGTGRITSIDTAAYKLSVGFENSDFFCQIDGKVLHELRLPIIGSNTEETYLGSLSATVSQNEKIWFENVSIDDDGSRQKLIVMEDLNPHSSIYGTIDIPNGYELTLEYTLNRTYGVNSCIVFKIITPRGQMLSDDIRFFQARGINNGDGIITIKAEDLPYNEKGYNTLFLYLGGMLWVEPMSFYERLQQELTRLDAYVYPSSVDGLIPQPYNQGGKFALPLFFAKNFLSSYDSVDEKERFEKYPVVNVGNGESYPPLTSGSAARHNIFCPMLYVAYIFDIIAERTGYTIEKNIFNDRSELQQLVLYNNYVENRLRTGSNGFSIFERNPQWDLRRHVSDMEISKFVSVLELFGAKLFVDSQTKTLSIRFLKDVLNTAPAFEANIPLKDFSCEPGFDNVEFSFECGESLAGDTGIDFSDKKLHRLDDSGFLPERPEYKNVVFRVGSDGKGQYFAYINGTDNYHNDPLDGWQLLGMVQNPFHKNEEAKNGLNVESPLGPIISGPLRFLLDRERIYETDADITGTVNSGDITNPKKKEGEEAEENTPTGLGFAVEMVPMWNNPYTVVEDEALLAGSYKSLEDEPSLGIGFARPMADGSTLLTHDTGLATQEGAPDSIALKWEGPNGLYETFWRTVAEWLTAPTTKKCKFTIPAMSVTDYEKMKRADKVRINQQNYIIDTLKADFADTVTNIQVEAYTCF